MASERARFGPAGNSDSFYAQGHKHSAEMPQWLAALGLDAYEYSFGRGVRLGGEKAAEIGAEARKHGIAASVHAPYYINLANAAPEARQKSRQYLLDSAAAAEAMGARRIVFHAGACMDGDRGAAMRLVLGELEAVLLELEDKKLTGALLCPETMGKPKQVGTLDEVIEMCRISDRLLPAVDFGHINALGQGCLRAKQDYERIVDAIDSGLGAEKARSIHVHFSHIEYGPHGECRHLTLEDDVFGPDFAPLAKVFRERAMRPVVICESRGVMAEDAVKLRRAYEAAG